MALRKCRECSERVSTRARTCPHCGSPTKKPTSLILTLFSVMLTAAMMMALAVGSIAVCVKVGDGCMSFGNQAIKDAEKKRRTTRGNTHGASVYMKKFVEGRLSSPGSADFPNWVSTKDIVTPLGGNRYRVKSYVDSENAFGANIRTSFDGVIVKTRDGWTLESLDLHE